eukprot:gnl/TRDRNA2_/TRDRNA2_130563_c0_seq1.p1 gnl/TRDRNA2_/TRDRNA2_130563_c0~~gnl/TRDRNA2_/TRDRNA2_130563_c0_seq1.p1  ORF type:complete len:497 (-),score=56.89 gnl/TRDRNA2_/TRDRNA2_130563_c0_seq1:239-1729(-)
MRIRLDGTQKDRSDVKSGGLVTPMCMRRLCRAAYGHDACGDVMGERRGPHSSHLAEALLLLAPGSSSWKRPVACRTVLAISCLALTLSLYSSYDAAAHSDEVVPSTSSTDATATNLGESVFPFFEEARLTWDDAGGTSLLDESGEPSEEHREHFEAFSRELFLKLHREAEERANLERVQASQPAPQRPSRRGGLLRHLVGILRHALGSVRLLKHAPAASNLTEPAALNTTASDVSAPEKPITYLDRADEIQRQVIAANIRKNKKQRRIMSADEHWRTMLRLPVAEEALAQPHWNLYSVMPPVLQRCMADDFATLEECRHVVGYSIRAMLGSARRGAQTSLGVGHSVYSRGIFAQLIAHLVERTRIRIIRDFGLQGTKRGASKPVLRNSGALLTRLQGNVSGDDEFEYWTGHVDKANIEAYDYAALLYLNTQGEHFKGGDFVFVDPDEDLLISPRLGRLVTFTGGPENLHQVRKVTSGARFVLAMWFELLSEPGRKA